MNRIQPRFRTFAGWLCVGLGGLGSLLCPTALVVILVLAWTAAAQASLVVAGWRMRVAPRTFGPVNPV